MLPGPPSHTKYWVLHTEYLMSHTEYLMSHTRSLHRAGMLLATHSEQRRPLERRRRRLSLVMHTEYVVFRNLQFTGTGMLSVRCGRIEDEARAGAGLRGPPRVVLG